MYADLSDERDWEYAYIVLRKPGGGFELAEYGEVGGGQPVDLTWDILTCVGERLLSGGWKLSVSSPVSLDLDSLVKGAARMGEPLFGEPSAHGVLGSVLRAIRRETEVGALNPLYGKYPESYVAATFTSPGHAGWRIHIFSNTVFLEPPGGLDEARKAEQRDRLIMEVTVVLNACAPSL